MATKKEKNPTKTLKKTNKTPNYVGARSAPVSPGFNAGANFVTEMMSKGTGGL